MRRELPSIIGGFIVFMIILSIIIYSNSDFDNDLIHKVEIGVPSAELIPKIDQETANQELNAKRRLESKVMDPKFWGNGSLLNPTDYSTYTHDYENDMKMILNLDNSRKRFAERQISKEQFLKEIQIPKFYLSKY